MRLHAKVFLPLVGTPFEGRGWLVGATLTRLFIAGQLASTFSVIRWGQAVSASRIIGCRDALEEIGLAISVLRLRPDRMHEAT